MPLDGPGDAVRSVAMRAFIISGPRAAGVRDVPAPEPVPGRRRRARRTRRRVRHGHRVLYRPDGVPPQRSAVVSGPDRTRVGGGRRRGRGGRRSGLDRSPGHGRHDARMRRVPALPGRATPRLLRTQRGRHQPRPSGRSRRAGRDPGRRAASTTRIRSTTRWAPWWSPEGTPSARCVPPACSPASGCSSSARGRSASWRPCSRGPMALMSTCSAGRPGRWISPGRWGSATSGHARRSRPSHGMRSSTPRTMRIYRPSPSSWSSLGGPW